MIINYDEYLLEEKLGIVLKKLAKSHGFVLVPQWKIGAQRCDFALFKSTTDTKPFVVYEFDGYHHYISSSAQKRDIKKNIALKEAGIKVKRIPYFVQLRNDVLKSLIPWADIKSSVMFEHGFISTRALLPTDFNSYGLYLFCEQLQLMPRTVAKQIWTSMLSRGIEEKELIYLPRFRTKNKTKALVVMQTPDYVS